MISFIACLLLTMMPLPLLSHTKRFVSEDFPCPHHDELRSEPGCQFSCVDNNCSNARELIRFFDQEHAPLQHFFTVNNCPMKGRWATLKAGRAKALATQDPCEYACWSKLSRVAMMERMHASRTLCSAPSKIARLNQPSRDAGVGSSTIGSASFMSTIALVDHVVHATNIVIDASKASYKGKTRSLAPGFILGCRVQQAQLPQGPTKRLLASTAPLSSRAGAPAPHIEQLLTIFITRDDMGNLGHHLSTVVGVWQIIDYYDLSTNDAQLVILDSRLMCSRPLRPDCPGPFNKLWHAISGGMRLRRFAQWTGSAPISGGQIALSEAIFQAAPPEASSLAWGPPIACKQPSDIFIRMQQRVLAWFNISEPSYGSNNKPSADKRTLALQGVESATGAKASSHTQQGFESKRGSTSAISSVFGDSFTIVWLARNVSKNYARRVKGREALLARVREHYTSRFRSISVRSVDPGSLSLRDQLLLVRRADLVAGLHGAAFAHAIWMRQGTAIVELFTRTYIRQMCSNIARFTGVLTFNWVNPDSAREAHDGIDVPFGSIAPVLDQAVNAVMNARNRSI